MTGSHKFTWSSCQSISTVRTKQVKAQDQEWDEVGEALHWEAEKGVREGWCELAASSAYEEAQSSGSFVMIMILLARCNS